MRKAKEREREINELSKSICLFICSVPFKKVCFHGAEQRYCCLFTSKCECLINISWTNLKVSLFFNMLMYKDANIIIWGSVKYLQERSLHCCFSQNKKKLRLRPNEKMQCLISPKKKNNAL